MTFQPKTVLSTDQELIDYFISFLKELRYELPSFLLGCDVYVDSENLGRQVIESILFKTYGLAEPDHVAWYYVCLSQGIELWRPSDSRTVFGGVEHESWRLAPVIRTMVAAGLLCEKDGDRITSLVDAAYDARKSESTIKDSLHTLSRMTGIAEEELKAFIYSHKTR